MSRAEWTRERRARRSFGQAAFLSVLASSGALLSCAPSATFTSARALPAGSVQHLAYVDVPVAYLEKRGQSTPRAARPQPRRDDTVAGLQLGYGLRVGVADSIEVGGNIGTGAAELSSKIQFLDGRALALAIAPRVMVAWASLIDDKSLTLARLPLLATIEPASWLDLTLRGGLGVVDGSLSSSGAVELSVRYPLKDPLAEAGLTALFRLSSRFGLALEAYGLRTLNDDTSGRTMMTGGGGLALVFGLAPQGSHGRH